MSFKRPKGEMYEHTGRLSRADAIKARATADDRPLAPCEGDGAGKYGYKQWGQTMNAMVDCDRQQASQGEECLQKRGLGKGARSCAHNPSKSNARRNQAQSRGREPRTAKQSKGLKTPGRKVKGSPTKSSRKGQGTKRTKAITSKKGKTSRRSKASSPSQSPTRNPSRSSRKASKPRSAAVNGSGSKQSRSLTREQRSDRSAMRSSNGKRSRGLPRDKKLGKTATRGNRTLGPQNRGSSTSQQSRRNLGSRSRSVQENRASRQSTSNRKSASAASRGSSRVKSKPSPRSAW